MQMIVFFVHGRSKADVVHKLTRSMAQVTTWLRECCLQLNVSKTVSMLFCKTNKPTSDHHIIVAGEKLQVVSELKYLGVLIDSNLTFKAHVKKKTTKGLLNSISQIFVPSEITCLQRLPKYFYTI